MSTNQPSEPTQQPRNSTQVDQPALDLLRQKIGRIYTDEPDVKEEIVEAELAGKHRSKHQQYMHELSTSGKSLAGIQTAWHAYYVGLPDQEKHIVWQEFYSEHSRAANYQATRQPVVTQPAQHHTTKHSAPDTPHDPRTAADIKEQLLGNVTAHRKKISKKAHIHSLLFGFGVGSFVILLMLFGFFNERFLAPFISPSKSVSNTPLVIDPSGAAIGPESKIIIPKINVEIPIVFDQESIVEKDIETSLESGVVHYATTPNPGEKGNGVIFGHSSNNILNKGKYKFAFVLLKQLETGDTFYVQKDGKRYVYKVSDKKVVKPTDVSILFAQSPKPSMTLVTCDPPGTSLNRLLVTGLQVSPDPGTNVASTARKDVTATPGIIPSNAPSLWQRLKDWVSS